MAKRRWARHCTAKRTNGEPCGGWSIAGGSVCSAHGGSAPQVRAAAYFTLIEAWSARVCAHESKRRDEAMVRWLIPRIAIASQLLGVPVEEITREHIWWCRAVHGVPAAEDPPRPPLDRRFKAPRPPERKNNS